MSFDVLFYLYIAAFPCKRCVNNHLHNKCIYIHIAITYNYSYRAKHVITAKASILAT